VKGIIHATNAKPKLKLKCLMLSSPPSPRPRGDGSNDDIRLGRIASFAEIVEREAQGERHMRLFAPLTFLWPRIIPTIVDGTAPADLTVTSFAKALPYSQAQQERAIVFAACRNPDAASKLRCLAQDTGACSMSLQWT
jgi:hypothetical protein